MRLEIGAEAYSSALRKRRLGHEHKLGRHGTSTPTDLGLEKRKQVGHARSDRFLPFWSITGTQVPVITEFHKRVQEVAGIGDFCLAEDLVLKRGGQGFALGWQNNGKRASHTDETAVLGTHNKVETRFDAILRCFNKLRKKGRGYRGACAIGRDPSTEQVKDGRCGKL